MLSHVLSSSFEQCLQIHYQIGRIHNFASSECPSSIGSDFIWSFEIQTLRQPSFPDPSRRHQPRIQVLRRYCRNMDSQLPARLQPSPNRESIRFHPLVSLRKLLKLLRHPIPHKRWLIVLHHWRYWILLVDFRSDNFSNWLNNKIPHCFGLFFCWSSVSNRRVLWQDCRCMCIMLEWCQLCQYNHCLRCLWLQHWIFLEQRHISM